MLTGNTTLDRKQKGTLKLLSLFIKFLFLFLFASCNSDGAVEKAANDTTAAKTNPDAELSNAHGIHIHYVTGGTGKPLVLLHGRGRQDYYRFLAGRW